ncbi:ribonuclease Ps, partial [Thalictrum thalictroides]
KDETGILVNCLSREGQLAQLEVMGSKGLQFLQKILHPVPETSESSLELMGSSVVETGANHQLRGSIILKHAIHLPDNAVVSLTVKDPRDLDIDGPSEETSDSLAGDGVKDEPNALAAYPDQKEKSISSFLLNSEVSKIVCSDSKEMWNIHSRVNPPVDENILCTEKHQKRIDFFHLDKTARMETTTTIESRSCSVLLLKDRKRSLVRWTIILPLSWVKAFWVPLVNHGAHAIGLRERRWVACDVGLPSFPYDFPDCKAYSRFMAAESIASDEKMELRPLAMRPLKVPIPPPWESVRHAFEDQLTNVGDIQDIHEEKNACDSLGDIGSANCESEVHAQDDFPFKGIIARTSSILSCHLKKNCGGHSLLYPNEQMGKKTTLLENRDKNVPGPGGDCHLRFDRKLCFVRVIIRAYREGAFEEGSVVCAPRLTDISLLKSRLDVEEGKLQIPESLLGSYYTLQESGKWELQKPEDPDTKESHRWPIGFVTTGFVRGSTKPTAEAFCEATLLAELRREQWEGKQGKQKKCEIFVLVRHLRSTAYRLALATIVLEQQREDVEFM